MAAADILKSGKTVIYPLWIYGMTNYEEIWHGDASCLSKPDQPKNGNFKNPRWWWPPFKKSKITISHNGLMDFDKIWRDDVPRTPWTLSANEI